MPPSFFYRQKTNIIMRKIALWTSCMLFCLRLAAQSPVSGDWNGSLEIGAMKLRLVFHIEEKEGVYTATMDSPDQGAKGIPVPTVSFRQDTLSLEAPALRMLYTGVLKGNLLDGQFEQGAVSVPLKLHQGLVAVRRPQTPPKPYPYLSEEVWIDNTEAGIALSGTLSRPFKGSNFPAVVLVSGSGPQNRDEEIFEHKPFLILSDYLTRHGIAVLRYDDRGTAKSGGIYNTAGMNDFASDALAAVQYLKTRKEINPEQIGIAGHSEGGCIAILLAAKHKEEIAFIVSLAGVAIRGDSLMKAQRYLIGKAYGMSDADIRKNEEMLSKMPVTSPELLSILQWDPAPLLPQIQCPVLAVNGEKDLQVPSGMNLEAVKAGVKQATVKEYPGLNHLFQHAVTGLPAEYGQIEETMAPEVLQDITAWILQIISQKPASPNF